MASNCGRVVTVTGGFIHQLDALTGLQLPGLAAGYASTVGIPGPPQIVDLAVNTGITRATGEQADTRRLTTLVSGVGGIDTTHDENGIAKSTMLVVSPTGRASWREISNWNDKTGH